MNEIPTWLRDAQQIQDDLDALDESDLARCQALVADLRAAMLAAAAVLHREGDGNLAMLLESATGTNAEAISARRALAEDAGYFPGTRGECYP